MPGSGQAGKENGDIWADKDIPLPLPIVQVEYLQSSQASLPPPQPPTILVGTGLFVSHAQLGASHPGRPYIHGTHRTPPTDYLPHILPCHLPCDLPVETLYLPLVPLAAGRQVKDWRRGRGRGGTTTLPSQDLSLVSCFPTTPHLPPCPD